MLFTSILYITLDADKDLLIHVALFLKHLFKC